MAQRVHATSSLQRDYEMLRESLLQEQARRSALEVEKRTPVLVHPWRILQVGCCVNSFVNALHHSFDAGI